MSLLDDSISSYAVLQSTYALSCLYMYGEKRAMIFKRRAMAALAGASQHDLDDMQKLQLVAAYLLLTRFEVGQHKSHSISGIR